MLRLRTLLPMVLLAGWTGLVPGALAQGESPWIQIGRYDAHPTRILARLQADRRPTDPGVSELLSSIGLEVTREYRRVSGLVLLDVPVRQRLPLAVAVVPGQDQLKESLLSRLAALRDSGLFLYAEPDYIRQFHRTPTDAKFLDGSLWGLRNIGDQGGVVGVDISAETAWDLTVGSTNVIVAVVDSGVRYDHRDLSAQMWQNPNEVPNDGADNDDNGYVDDVFGINAVNDSGDPMDSIGHGSHVSGTIGAAANNGYDHVGVNWNVRIMACRVGGASGLASADIVEGIEYAVENGASVMNASFGGGPYMKAEFDAIAAARDAGVLFVASAGNDAMDNDEEPAYPANYDLDNIISVAAIDRSDQLASFSNYGATTVDLGAPGVDIYSTVATSTTAYEYYQGTSMAAPHVTGVAALIRAYYPNISLVELRERLLKTVVPTVALNGITVTGGRVNAYKALSAVGDNELEVAITPPNNAVLLAGSTNNIFVTVTDMFSVTNATVKGTYGTNGTVNFVNNGTAPDAAAGDAIYSGRLVAPTNVSELILTVIVTAPAPKTPSTNVVRYTIVSPPGNDMFAHADKVPPEGGVILSDNQYATIEFQEPFHADNPTVASTLWWMWSSPASTDIPVLIDTAGSTFDTVVAVYTGTNIANVKEVAAADDVNGRRHAYLTFTAEPAKTYRIVVGGADDEETGTVRLRVEMNGVPDTLAPVAAFTWPGSGYISPTNRVEVTGLAFDPQPGASGIAEVLVRINQDFSGKRADLDGDQWSSNFLLQEGQNTIYATAVDNAGLQSITVKTTVYYWPPDPSNDHFVNALELTGDSGSIACSNQRATKESGEPNHAGNEGGHSIWYRWTAPADGMLQVLTTNVSYDTLLGVYTGTRVDSLTTVAANDDFIAGNRYSKVTLGVRAATTYSIALDGYAASAGTNRLLYAFTNRTLFHLGVTATAGGSVAPTPAEADYEAASTVTLTATPLPGYRFVRWTGSVESTDNPLALLMDQDHVLVANFAPESFTDDFETGSFSPVLSYALNPAGSHASWRVQSTNAATGQYAARSGAIGNGQKSVLQLTEILDAGVLSFDFRVSSEEGWDHLQFWLNGTLVTNWSGAVDWTRYAIVVPAGTNTVEWRYAKDFADPPIKDFEDAAYLDNLTLPLASLTESAVRLQMVGSAEQPTLRLIGESGQTYVIESSTDLMGWTPVSTNLAVGGVIPFDLSTDAGSSAQFYRAYRR